MVEVSIIIATRNRADRIGRAIESVLAQPVELQLIVVDGASTDGTMDVVDRYSAVEAISEPDAGVYDAWNKGVALSSGLVIGFVNDDDRLLDAALPMALQAFSGTDSVCGGAVVVDPTGRTVARHGPSPLDLGLISFGPIIPNARFWRREVFDRVGPFDGSYRVAGDREWLLRAWMSGVRTLMLDQDVYEYSMHGTSLTFNAKGAGDLGTDEGLRICRSHWSDPRVHRELQRWHSRKAGHGVAQALRDQQWGRASRLVKEAFETDPLWPGRFVPEHLRSRRR